MGPSVIHSGYEQIVSNERQRGLVLLVVFIRHSIISFSLAGMSTAGQQYGNPIGCIKKSN